MAVFGRFQVYYGKIKSELEIIREDYGYTNLSKAFAHWYLANYVKVSEQELGEIIIDGKMFICNLGLLKQQTLI